VIKASTAPTPAPAIVVQARAEDNAAAVQAAIRTSLAPLLEKQQALEARLEREVSERQRLRHEVERLTQAANSWAAPPDRAALPQALDGSRRRRWIGFLMLAIAAIALTAMFSAMLLSHSR
jgi:hypothetical protein